MLFWRGAYDGGPNKGAAPGGGGVGRWLRGNEPLCCEGAGAGCGDEAEGGGMLRFMKLGVCDGWLGSRGDARKVSVRFER